MKRVLLPLVLFSALSFAQEPAPAPAPQKTPDQQPAKPQSAVPPIPDFVPKNARIYSIVRSGNLAGHGAVWSEGETRRAFVEFNDRGRGPRLDSSYVLGKNGLPAKMSVKGVEYMKSAVEENFSMENGTARWKNPSEDGSATNAGEKFYLSLYGPAEEFAMMVRAALQRGGRLELLPAGSIQVSKVDSLTVGAGDQAKRVHLYSVTGLDLTPALAWFDDNNEFFAAGGTWHFNVLKGYEGVRDQLIKVQDDLEQKRNADLAKNAMKRPAGDILIRNVNVFDANSGKVLANRTVVVKGNRIAEVRATSAADAKAAGTVIDGTGKTLLPGLWDMHGHLSSTDALLNIASGVTTVRDMANDVDDIARWKKRFDEGSEIGPRIIAAGFLDGRGPFQGPTKALVDTEQEALQWIEKYHSLGYPQIRIYSSLKPELVKFVFDEAHKRGMHTSGHIPAGMTASQTVALGQDEITHMNQFFLNFMPDVKETRNPSRFTEPAKRAAGIDLKSEQVQSFIKTLKQKKIVVDPTMTAWEGMFVARRGRPDPSFASVIHRFPAQLQRGFKSAGGALPITAETDQLYVNSYKKMVAMVKELYDNGIQLVAGTDNFAGFALHRELEIYNEAGIPPAEVLKIATLQSAKVMNKDKELGSIEKGKLADMMLVNGDPTKNISDVRKTVTVFRDGAVVQTADIYKALGIQP